MYSVHLFGVAAIPLFIPAYVISAGIRAVVSIIWETVITVGR